MSLGHSSNPPEYWIRDISGTTFQEWWNKNRNDIKILNGQNTYSGLAYNSKVYPLDYGHPRYHIQSIEPPHYWYKQDWVETASGTKHWVIMVS